MSIKKQKLTLDLLQRLRCYRPQTRQELAAYVEAYLGLKVPGKRMCSGHNSPLDYLAYSFFGNQKVGSEEDKSGKKADAQQDVVVWANRGGGKTQLGAAVSLLECLFLPGCDIRILGGSEEQSRRMYEYLRGSLEQGYTGKIEGRITQKGCRFANGASVQVLTQSDRSVRGHHVQRLRCDEVELFDPEVWQAAQFITNSGNGISGRLEVFSTLHRPYGLMQEILRQAPGSQMRVFRWCLWEVIEPCRDRNCSQCVLWEDCRGRAKEGQGYYSIDDAISQKRRSSKQSWQVEMLCQRPSRSDLVFAEFDRNEHVQSVEYQSDLPLYRSIDFGFSNPLACLLLQVDGNGCVRVLDEHIKNQTTLSEHARLIQCRWPRPVAATYCDPAGKQRNEITGSSLVQEMAALGMPVRYRSSRILDGLEMIRRFLNPAEGKPKLVIAPKCEQLIRAFESYHYARGANGTLTELPEKDGVHDHVVDALRYFFVNRFARKFPLREKKY